MNKEEDGRKEKLELDLEFLIIFGFMNLQYSTQSILITCRSLGLLSEFRWRSGPDLDGQLQAIKC